MKKQQLGRELSRVFSTRNMTMLAVLSAMAYLLYAFIKFPLPFFPPFLDMQFSDLPILLGGFIIGPVGGVVIVIMRFVLKIVTIGSSTAYVGELCDMILSTSFVLTACVFYRFHRTKKGALLGIGFGALVCLLTAVLANMFIIIPFYVEMFFHGSWEPLLEMVKSLYGTITREQFFAYYIPLAVIPFNAMRLLACSAVTYLVYKRLSRALAHIFKPHTQRKAQQPHIQPEQGEQQAELTISSSNDLPN